MKEPLIRQGRYICKSTGEAVVLVSWSEDTVTFNGNIVVTLDVFDKEYRLVQHEG